MMRKGFALLALGLALGAPAFAQPVTIGEHVQELFETPHPYPGPGAGSPAWSDTIHFPGATYIAPHFARFELAPGDEVIVRSPDGEQSWTYNGLGKRDLGQTAEGFFAAHINGDTAVIELFSAGGGNAYGYRIDLYGRGYNDAEIQAFWDAGLGEIMNLPYPPSEAESICGVDDSLEAKCFLASEPTVYERSRTVARLLLNGSAWCTGWLIGCEGHVMTNQHCVPSQSTANNIDFEFMAEGPDCATSCQSALACPGTIEASGGTLVAVDAALDYALLDPDTSVAFNTDLAETYGFLQLRPSGAVLDEQIYIPGHPAGWGKRVSYYSTYPTDTGGVAHAVSLTEPACSGGPGDVGYWADTQGGSSGSPVLAYSDHKVVALHHCRGSSFCVTGNPSVDDPNRGVPIDAIIADLGPALPQCATGTFDYNLVSQTETVSTTVVASCPAGQQLVSGGCADSTTAGLRTSLPITSPLGTEAWYCIYDSNPGSLTAYAYCADGGVSIGKEEVLQNEATSTTPFVYCPAGKKVISGGCLDSYSATRLRSTISYFAGASNFHLCVYESNPGSLYAAAVCIDEDVDLGRELVYQVETSSNVSLVYCPTGKRLLGGGCHDGTASAFLHSEVPISSPPTEVYVCVHNQATGSLTAFGICVDP